MLVNTFMFFINKFNSLSLYCIFLFFWSIFNISWVRFLLMLVIVLTSNDPVFSSLKVMKKAKCFVTNSWINSNFYSFLSYIARSKYPRLFWFLNSLESIKDVEISEISGFTSFLSQDNTREIRELCFYEREAIASLQ